MDKQKRQDYANELNDREHLLTVKVSLNRAKRDRGPDEWKPPNKMFWCEYGKGWERVKLTITTAEAGAVHELEQHCN